MAKKKFMKREAAEKLLTKDGKNKDKKPRSEKEKRKALYGADE